MSDEVSERHVRVQRTARYHLLGASVRSPAELWIVLHGYGQLSGRFIRRFAALDDGTRVIVAPEALNRFYLGGTTGPHGADAKIGATWMTREDRLAEIGDYVEYLDRVFGRVYEEFAAQPARVVALGFSQGVATIVRWIGLGKESARVNDAILWAGTLPPEAEEFGARLLSCRWISVVGEEDTQIHQSVTTMEPARMQAMGLSSRVVTFAGGHRIDDSVLQDLVAGLTAGAKTLP